MIKKLALHWQILIALVLALIYGLSFPNAYKVSVRSYNKILSEKKSSRLTGIQMQNIENLIGENALSENDFMTKINANSAIELTEKQKKLIKNNCLYNPEIKYVAWLGTLFIKVLKMITIPLILMSVISGIANIGSAGNLGRISLKTILYYMLSSTVAIITGLFFVNIIRPGDGLDKSYTNSIEIPELDQVVLSDTLLNIIPENIFRSLVENEMLSIIFFAVLFGFFITKISTKSKIFLTDLFNAGFELMMKITMFVIKFTPLGVFGLIAVAVSEQTGYLRNFAETLGLYTLTVLSALAIHAFIVLPLFLKFIARVKPYAHFKAMQSALLTAFSTSSSGAALSLTMEAVENKTGVSNKISGFTLPLGATVNMDGTALYEAITVLFIAQVYGFDLTVNEQIIIVITALLASVGAAAIPMAGLIMMSVILSAVDLPLAGIALILPVERILDMFRTSVNVWSDSCGAVIIAKSEGEKLKI